VLAGTGIAGSSPDGVRADQSPVLQPRGVAVGSDGTIYFAEAGAHRIRAIGSDGLLRTVAGTGVRGHTGDGGPATAAQINEPAGLLYNDGELYFAEYGGSAVRAIGASGTMRTIAGLGLPGFAGDGGPAVDARLDRPYALAVAGGGRSLVISDQGNDRVRVVDLVSGLIRTFAGTGSRVFTGNRRAAGETSLFSPAGLAAAAGFLFITDPGHSIVWRTATTFD
jgi:serine/threonine-protein kinase